MLYTMSMKDYSRALRRKHRARVYRKRKQNYKYLFENDRDLTFQKKWLKTPVPCSCTMCGNPRKFFKQKTRQERIAELQFPLH